MVINHRGPRLRNCVQAGDRAIRSREDAIGATLAVTRRPQGSGDQECQPAAELRETLNGERHGTYLVSHIRPVRLPGRTAMAPSAIHDVEIAKNPLNKLGGIWHT